MSCKPNTRQWATKSEERPVKRRLIEKRTQEHEMAIKRTIACISQTSLTLPVEVWYIISEFARVCPFFFLRRTCRALRALPIPRRLLTSLKITSLDVVGDPARDAAKGPLVNHGLVRYRNGLVIPQSTIVKQWKHYNSTYCRVSSIEGWVSLSVIKAMS